MQFTNITVEWSLKTFIFYLAIIIGCYLIACVLRKKAVKGGKGKKERCPAGSLIVAIILLFVKCFNTTGRDLRTGYYYNFQSAISMAAYRDQSVEPGFRLLMVIVRNITENYAVFLFVVGLITILPVIHILNKYRDKIDIPAAVLLYTSLYFINSFSAYRQYMAVSISLFAFDAILEKKPYKALAWIALSSTFHVSCVVLIIPYALCFARMMSKKLIAISEVVFFAVVYVGRGAIDGILGGTERYDIYTVSQQIKIGFEQIVYYIPFFLLIFLCRKEKTDKYFSKVAYIYILTGFVFGLLSYVVPIFGRMNAIFIPIAIVIPYFVNVYKQCHNKSKGAILSFLTVLYSIARFVIWIAQYFNLEDLMPYTNVFGCVM